MTSAYAKFLVPAALAAALTLSHPVAGQSPSPGGRALPQQNQQGQTPSRTAQRGDSNSGSYQNQQGRISNDYSTRDDARRDDARRDDSGRRYDSGARMDRSPYGDYTPRGRYDRYSSNGGGYGRYTVDSTGNGRLDRFSGPAPEGRAYYDPRDPYGNRGSMYTAGGDRASYRAFGGYATTAERDLFNWRSP